MQSHQAHIANLFTRELRREAAGAIGSAAHFDLSPFLCSHSIAWPVLMLGRLQWNREGPVVLFNHADETVQKVSNLTRSGPAQK